MNDLFIPKEIKERLINDLARDKTDFLVFGIGDMYEPGHIYGLYDFDIEAIKLATRNGLISDFCIHDDIAWDCGSYGLVKDTFGEPEKFVIKYPGAGVTTAKTEAHNVMSLLGRSDGTMIGGAYDTSFAVTDKVINNAKSNWIYSMVEFEDKLFCFEVDADNRKYCIRGYGPDAGFVEEYPNVGYLGVFNDRLYHSCDDKVYDTYGCSVVAMRNAGIQGLVNFKGELYDYGYDGKVFETFSGEMVYDFKTRVNAAIHLPRYLLREAFHE